MSTTAINSATNSLATQPSTGAGMDSLTSEDFFRILVTELQNQDPLKPYETSDMIGQVSDIRNIEVSKQLGDVLGQMANQQRTSGAGDMLGKFVIASLAAEDGTQYAVAGVVTGVRFDADGSAVLELDTGESIKAADVTHVTTVENAESLITADLKAASAAADSSDSTATTEAAGPLSWLGQLLGL
jgi:flagellar basal-body rod modification protein FlgD